MCGIFALLLSDDCDKIDEEMLNKYFLYGKKRGPEYSKLEKINKNIYFGFHRLAINGLDEISHQPIHEDKISLICNGEIYNYKQLFEKCNIIPKTNSDCEIILQLYKMLGSQCFNLLDGVFGCVLYNKETNEITLARDPYGVRPLYICYYENNNIGICSDIKPLLFDKDIKNIQKFTPGSYAIIKNNQIMVHETYFFNISYLPHSEEKSIEYYMYNALELLKNAIYKRVHNCEREVACLLSGGLDSSIISAYVSRFYKEKTGNQIETYSIGLEDAEDLKYASLVSKHINSIHHDIIFTNDKFLKSIPSVIKDIETYDTTTVRASVGNWNIGKYISENSLAKVIFNGDGADELMGGYMYFHCAPNDDEFHKENLRLLKDINNFDVLRSDKSISSHGLEPRTPFLDKEFTKYYLSIPIHYRNHNVMKKGEKYLIRKAIELYDSELLPKEVLWRTKEAFSDGVSSMEKSWYEIIQESLETKKFDEIDTNQLNMIPETNEQKHYYELFVEEFSKASINIIPYYWMPKYIKNANDSSARTLNIYKEKI